MKQYDFLVIGSGLAGLVYALEVAKKGKVAIVTKEVLSECNSNYAQGGIAVVLADNDTFEDHIADSFRTGCELGKKRVIETVVREGPDRIKALLDLGVSFTLNDNCEDEGKKKNLYIDLENGSTIDRTARNATKQDKPQQANENGKPHNKDNYNRVVESLSLTREGGHSTKRIVYAADSTGREVMSVLINHCLNHPNIVIYENHIAIDLITQHHIKEDYGFIPGITCWGGYILDCNSGKVITFKAKKTMIATGGAGQVYEHNTNSPVTTGDGYAMAYLAGSRMVNMEFIQFHPTSFYAPNSQSFLVSEALRGEGAVLTLPDGKEFMHKYHELGSLAPRDIVSRAVDYEMKAKGYTHLYLDATRVDKKVLKEHFPFIDKKCQEHGVDFSIDPIPIVPSAHYFCGGILATIDGLTDIKNLFVAGEAACTGFHGANRLASNSLLEALVVAYRAGNYPSNEEEVVFPDIPEWEDTGSFNESEWVIISHNSKVIRKIMQGYAGIVRSRRLLKYAYARLRGIYDEVNEFYQNNPVKKEVIETRNLAIVASLIVRSALIRKESRGAHYIVDFPETSEQYKKDTIIY